MNKIKVILVDDHSLVREGYKMMLHPVANFEVIDECSNEQQYKKSLENNLPDVVIMDIKLPGSSGIELCKYTRQYFPKVKVLFVSANTDKHHIQLALKAGGGGFISKNTNANDFIRAIEIVFSGNEYFSKEISESMLKLFSENTRNRINGDAPLSNREIEIISLICEGKDFNTIGNELHISPRTVETHKKNILEKLQLANTVDLVKYAIRNNISEA